MGALTKAELAEHLHAELALSKREARSSYRALVTLIYVISANVRGETPKPVKKSPFLLVGS